MTTTTAADILCGALRREGVEIAFGHPGGAILPVYDALHRHGGIRHVLSRHEQGAAHAADGYARVTGRVGVCLATSGPGATNLVTGLATAMMDSVPVVAITGQVPRSSMGTQAFQETDIVGVTMPVTKHGFLVQEPGEVARVIREAFELARSGRPGPVLVDIPKCVQQEPCSDLPASVVPNPQAPCTSSPHTATLPPRTPGRRSSDPAGAFHPSSFSGNGRLAPGSRNGAGSGRTRPEGSTTRAARLLDEAKRPVVMAGRGVVLSATSDVLRHLAEESDLPVATTLLGLDAFPATDARALGMPGMHGTERANHAIQEADLILGLGLRFDDRVTGATGTFAPDARIVHFDVDPAVVGRSVDVDLAVVGDLRETLPALASTVSPTRRPGWWRRLREWDREIPLPLATSQEDGRLTGRRTIRALARRIAASRSVVVSDVGQHQMWLAQELRDADPGTHLTSGGLGTMGYALPAALGASFGAGERPVWVVAGDGGFQMTLQELATVAQEARPIRIAVVNNGFLGMVRQWQELFYGQRYSATELSGPDLVLVARAYGIAARSVSDTGELDDALDWAEASEKPVLLDLRVREEENVYPMVPSGAALDEMIMDRKEPAPL